MKAGLTQRQLDALAFIAGYIRGKGVSPSYHEIGHALGLTSVSGVSRIVKALVQRGHLTQTPGLVRSLALKDRLGDRRAAFIASLIPVLVEHYGPEHPRVVEARGLS